MKKKQQELRFISLLHDFRDVYRHVPVRGRDENDAEHSYQLAMLAWYFSSALDLQLDQTKLLKYALIHDLLESRIGDRNGFFITEAGRKAKEKDEALALTEIEKSFPETRPILQALKDYAEKPDEESRFIYLLDKFLPVINIFASDEDWYKENKINYKDHQAWLKKKVEESGLKGKKSYTVIESFLEILEVNQDRIFYTE